MVLVLIRGTLKPKHHAYWCEYTTGCSFFLCWMSSYLQEHYWWHNRHGVIQCWIVLLGKGQGEDVHKWNKYQIFVFPMLIPSKNLLSLLATSPKGTLVCHCPHPEAVFVDFWAIQSQLFFDNAEGFPCWFLSDGSSFPTIAASLFKLLVLWTVQTFPWRSLVKNNLFPLLLW